MCVGCNNRFTSLNSESSVMLVTSSLSTAQHMPWHSCCCRPRFHCCLPYLPVNHRPFSFFLRRCISTMIVFLDEVSVLYPVLIFSFTNRSSDGETVQHIILPCSNVRWLRSEDNKGAAKCPPSRLSFVTIVAPAAVFSIPVYDKYRIVVHKSTYYVYTTSECRLSGPCGGSLICLDGVIKCVVTDKTGHELEGVGVSFCFVSILYVFPAWTMPHCRSRQYLKFHEVAITSLPSSGCKPVSRLCARLISYALVIFHCVPVRYRAFRQKCFSPSLSKSKPLCSKRTFL